MGRAIAIVAAILMSRPALALSGKEIALSGTQAGAPACASCHGAAGQGHLSAGVPRIAGHNEGYIIQQLANFAAGTRESDVMKPIASALDEENREAVAGYYASLKPRPAPSAATKDSAIVRAGAALSAYGDWAHGVPGCSQCHGMSGEGVGTTFPRLSGQNADYIEAQIRAFRSGKRHDDPMGLMSGIAAKLSDAQVASVAAYYAAMPDAHVTPDVAQPAASAGIRADGTFTPPPESAIPADEFGAMVRLGENIFRGTQRYAASYVGNTLTCQNCHLDGGRLPDSAPLWAAYVSYPAYSAKNGQVNTYAERIQGCFRYSMNGKVPVLGSEPLVALEAYSYFLASGAPVGDTKMKGRGYGKLAEPEAPMSYAHGQLIYAEHCALCHGANGEGQRSASGAIAFPALWGPKSYNWGAGMGDIKNAAAFIKHNMPFSQGMTLSDQDAWDVAMFVDSHERPQDPRFTGNLAETAKKYHAGDTWMYGKTVSGVLLGAHSPASGPR
jgi:thiosulfate dehydrogenase